MAELTTTEAALMGLLAEGEASGYDLKKWVDESVGYFWQPAKSQIYAVLPRLVSAGLAKQRTVPQSNRPDKRLYRITPSGRAALRAWLERPAGDDSGRLLLKIFFGRLAGPDVALRHIREWRVRLESLRGDLEEIETRASKGPGDFYPSLTRAYGLAYAEALVQWTQVAERRLGRRRRVAR